MLKCIFHAEGRDDLINFGYRLGLHSVQNPMVVTFGGAADQGKSVVGFGADMAHRPELYPGGKLLSSLNADEWLRQDDLFPERAPVIYYNFRQAPVHSRAEFRRLLEGLRATYDESCLYIAANIELARNFNTASGRLISPQAAHFDFRPEGSKALQSRITVTAEDEELISALTASGLRYDKL